MNIGLWEFTAPRLKWDGEKYIPVNYEACGIVLGWNIEINIKQLYERKTK